MREIACIGCKYHEAEAKYNQMLQGLVIEHYCRKTGERFKPTIGSFSILKRRENLEKGGKGDR